MTLDVDLDDDGELAVVAGVTAAPRRGSASRGRWRDAPGEFESARAAEERRWTRRGGGEGRATAMDAARGVTAAATTATAAATTAATAAATRRSGGVQPRFAVASNVAVEHGGEAVIGRVVGSRRARRAVFRDLVAPVEEHAALGDAAGSVSRTARCRRGGSNRVGRSPRRRARRRSALAKFEDSSRSRPGRWASSRRWRRIRRRVACSAAPRARPACPTRDLLGDHGREGVRRARAATRRRGAERCRRCAAVCEARDGRREPAAQDAAYVIALIAENRARRARLPRDGTDEPRRRRRRAERRRGVSTILAMDKVYRDLVGLSSELEGASSLAVPRDRHVRVDRRWRRTVVAILDKYSERRLWRSVVVRRRPRSCAVVRFCRVACGVVRASSAATA